MQYLEKNSFAFLKKIFLGIIFGILFFISSTIPTFASINFSGFSFEDTFTVSGKTFYADIVQESPVEIVDGTYDLKAAFGFYGNDADMELYDAQIDDGVVLKYKKNGTTVYLGTLGVDASEDHVSSPNYPNGHASTYEMSSARDGNYAEPGVYQIDALLNNNVLTSLEVCLSSFVSPSGATIGNETCGVVNNGGGEPETTPPPGGGNVPETTPPGGGNPPETTPPGGSPENTGPAFGDGTSQINLATAITNVPTMTWNDKLSFRLRTQTNDVTILGFSVQDLQNGNFNPANFSLQNLTDFQFDFIGALNLQNLLSGNMSFGDAQLPGIEIQGIQFVYDFFYDIQATMNLNGRTYSKVAVYFGRYPEQLTKKVAEYTNVSGSLTIEGKVYNENNNNETEVVKTPMFVGRPYFLGIYGEYDDNGVARSETIAIKRLPEYIARPIDGNRIDVNWSASPYMSITGNSVKFSFSGLVDSRNMTRENTTLKFGEGSYTFKNVAAYPANLGPDFPFQRVIENLYVDAATFTTLPIRPGKTYYAGMYEGDELVSFILAGRTPLFTQSTEPETTPEEDPETEGESLFNADPFADLAQDLESGIVPCDGLNVECDYNKVITLIERGIKFIFIMIIPIAAIAFAYAGFLLLFQGSNPEKRKHARDILIKVLIGIAIVLAAWLIVKTILVSLGVDQSSIWLDLSNSQ